MYVDIITNVVQRGEEVLVDWRQFRKPHCGRVTKLPFLSQISHTLKDNDLCSLQIIYYVDELEVG